MSKYYQENKERLQKLVKDIKIFPKKKRHYGRERYENPSEAEKNKLAQ